MQYLLDTHVLAYWLTKHRKLQRGHAQILKRLERSGHRAAVSCFTLWELAMLVQSGRLQVDTPLERWLNKIEEMPTLEILPITSSIAADSVQLGADFHGDPADRIIVATARCHRLQLLTSDVRIIRWAAAGGRLQVS